MININATKPCQYLLSLDVTHKNSADKIFVICRWRLHWWFSPLDWNWLDSSFGIRIVCVYHYGDVIMSAIASQITSVSIVFSTIVQAQTKENIKAPRHWPLWGESTVDFPPRSASNAENVSFWWRYHVLEGKRNTNEFQTQIPFHINTMSSYFAGLCYMQRATD